MNDWGRWVKELFVNKKGISTAEGAEDRRGDVAANQKPRNSWNTNGTNGVRMRRMNLKKQKILEHELHELHE
jgi:hypothetical protein